MNLGTYEAAGCEDCNELVLVLVVLVFIKTDHLTLDPRVAHRLEDCHSKPEPDVESS